MPLPSRLRVVLSAAAVAALVTACGGGSGETTDPTPPPADTDSAPEEPEQPNDEPEADDSVDSTVDESDGTDDDEAPDDAHDGPESNDDGTDAAEDDGTDTEDEPAGRTGDGSSDNPYAVGDVLELNDWEVTITEVTLDATDLVMAANEFNDPPVEGRQFILFGVSATYNGDDSAVAWVQLQFTVVGSSGDAYGGQWDDFCGLIPNSLRRQGEQFPGDTVTGNECMSVPTAQVDGSHLIIEEAFAFEGDQIFVALG